MDMSTQAAGVLDGILQAIPHGVVAIDRQERIVLLNAVAARILGCEHASALGQPIRDLIANTRLPTVFETGRADSIGRMAVNGRQVITTRVPVFVAGELVAAAAIFQEMEELEAISQELSVVRRLNREYDAIFESSWDGIVVADGKGRLLRVNRAYERITGIRPSDIIGRDMQEMVNSGMVDHSSTLEVLSQRKPITIVQTVKTGRVMLVTGSPIFDEQTGEIVCVVSNCRDLTELNQLQRQLEESQAETRRYRDEASKLRGERLAAAEVVARSPAMRRALDMALRMAEVDSTVLITGESGAGKDVVAQTIHKTSHRAEGPFIRVNCGAIPESLLESELFGYADGAFTGAKRGGKPGMFELAHGGTLFLDEVGDLPLNMQVKLLNALQEKTVVPVGGTRPRQVDVRVIAATNHRLESRIATGSFRADLYYRLNVLHVEVPPLRERPEDIQALVFHFLKRLNQRFVTNKKLHPLVVDLLLSYKWPGNVRELQNVMERLVVLSPEETIGPELLPDYFRTAPPLAAGEHRGAAARERELLAALYQRFGSTRAVAAHLGCHQSTVVRKLKRHGISAQP